MNGANRPNRWQRFAEEAPQFYILTDPELARLDPEERRQQFFSSGEADVKDALACVDRWNHGWGCAVEIGCGIGRLTLPLARRFAETRAIDVAPTMLKHLQNNAHAAGIENILTYQPDEAWDDGEVDYVYSLLVFQHVPELKIIDDYLTRIGRALILDGVAQLQFDTRPSTAAYVTRNLLPDVLLPRSQRKGIRRIRRRLVDLLAIFDRAGLVIADQWGHETAQHTFVLRRADTNPT